MAADSLPTVLIVLPPSEGKAAPLRGPALDLASLSFPELTPVRERVLDALASLCDGPIDRAVAVLGLGRTQSAEAERNRTLRSRPTAPAIRVYSGVLFDALDYRTLTPRGRRRAQDRIAISSGLWGLVRPMDRIPDYRLSGAVTLPGMGTLAGAWRGAVGAAIEGTSGLIIDLRSGTYAALGPVPSGARRRVVTVRVLQESDGRRTIVSHMNKATKGRVVRSLLEGDEQVASPVDLLDALHQWGYDAELTASRPGTAGTSIDVIVRDL